MTEPAPISLSPSGQARKDRMLIELTAGLRVHRQRRVRHRRLATAMALLVVAGAAIMVAGRVPGPVQPTPTFVRNGSAELPRPPRPVMQVAFVTTDPSVLERCLPRPAGRIEIISDDGALVRALRDVDRPAGVVRVGNVLKLTAKVTDAELVDGAHNNS